MDALTPRPPGIAWPVAGGIELRLAKREQQLIDSAMQQANGVKRRAAMLMGISRFALERRMTRLAKVLPNKRRRNETLQGVREAPVALAATPAGRPPGAPILQAADACQVLLRYDGDRARRGRAGSCGPDATKDRPVQNRLPGRYHVEAYMKKGLLGTLTWRALGTPTGPGGRIQVAVFPSVAAACNWLTIQKARGNIHEHARCRLRRTD